MADGSPDRRKRSKWDDPRDSRLGTTSTTSTTTTGSSNNNNGGNNSTRDNHLHHHHHHNHHSSRHDRDRSSGRSRWDDRRDDHRSRSPEGARRRSRSPALSLPRPPVTPLVEPKKAVDPAAAAGSSPILCRMWMAIPPFANLRRK